MSMLNLLTIFGVRDDSVYLDGHWKSTVLRDFRKRSEESEIDSSDRVIEK